MAAKLDVAQLSDITKVHGLDTFERPIYARNAITTVQSLDTIKRITLRTTGFGSSVAKGGSAVVESIAAVADCGKSAFIGSEILESDRPELTVAKIIASGGRVHASSDKFNEVLTPLAWPNCAACWPTTTRPPAAQYSWPKTLPSHWPRCQAGCRCRPATGRMASGTGHRRRRHG